jgi:hypothetical protein
VALNVYSLAANYGGCLDCYGPFGFPFVLGDERVFKHGQFNWTGLLAGTAFGAVLSLGLGYAATVIWRETKNKVLSDG